MFRIHLSNVFKNKLLQITAAHVARSHHAATSLVEVVSDHILMFQGRRRSSFPREPSTSSIP